MSKIRIVNLLDDFHLGGVTRGLGIFETPAVRAVAESTVLAVDPRAVVAPALDVDVALVHFPPNWRRLLFLAALRLRNPAVRLILVEHSYTGAWEALKVTRKRRFRAMLRIAVRMVHQVVCVSNGQAQWLRETVGVAAGKIAVIHPFSCTEGLDAVPAPDFDDIAPDGGDTGRPLCIGAYGRFCEQKGFDNFLQNFRDGWFPGCELVLGGFGPDEDRLREIAGDADNIHFYGKVTDIAGYLATVDVVALPSRWEAYGQVANEAREAGRPILVAPVDGLPEQVGAAGLVVDFSDRAAIATALSTLTPEWLAAMSRAGRDATHRCGEHRARQWAALLSPRMATRLARRPGFDAGEIGGGLPVSA